MLNIKFCSNDDFHLIIINCGQSVLIFNASKFTMGYLLRVCVEIKKIIDSFQFCMLEYTTKLRNICGCIRDPETAEKLEGIQLDVYSQQIS